MAAYKPEVSGQLVLCLPAILLPREVDFVKERFYSSFLKLKTISKSNF